MKTLPPPPVWTTSAPQSSAASVGRGGAPGDPFGATLEQALGGALRQGVDNGAVLDRQVIDSLMRMVQLVMERVNRAWQGSGEAMDGASPAGLAPLAGGAGGGAGDPLVALLASRGGRPVVTPGGADVAWQRRVEQSGPGYASVNREQGVVVSTPPENAAAAPSLAVAAATEPSTTATSPASSATEGAAPPYQEIIQRAAARYDLDPRLLRAVVQTESGYNPRAVSPVGAQGLMQLMPATARELGVTDPFDPEQNVMGGARYLRQLLDRYQGRRELALAAYNWGMGNLERRPLAMPQETRTYLARINSLMASSG